MALIARHRPGGGLGRVIPSILLLPPFNQLVALLPAYVLVEGGASILVTRAQVLG